MVTSRLEMDTCLPRKTYTCQGKAFLDVTRLWGGERGKMRPLKASFLNLPIFYKILIANSLVVVVGAMGGTWLTRLLSAPSNFTLLTLLSCAGIALSILVNFFILKGLLRPLSSLQETVERAYQGNAQVRASLEGLSDPDLNRLAAALNTILDRLEAYTRTVETYRQQLRALSGRVITAQEEERRRIARELHDETSQALTTLIINLSLAEKNLPPELAETREALRATRRLASQTLEDVRKLVYNLRPTALDDLGLVPALRWYARNHLDKIGVQVRLEAKGCTERLSPQVETTIFRIAQEAINNIAKHAQARNARLSLGMKDSRITLMVEDDGRGFDVDEVLCSTEERRLGLFGIEERVALLGGTFHIESQPGHGTRLSVQVPLG
jgi:two-component system sensor histidine kinase UhpB